MLLFNRYEYDPQTDLIGKGGFARVYRALDKKLKRKVALKIYKPSDLAGKYSPIAEIQRVVDLDHPNITRYIDIEELERDDSFGEKEKIQVCVMELLEEGNLSRYFNANRDLVVFKKLLIDVLHGLSYLHRNGITHRDIKPSNILIKNTLDGPIAKITDFGISKRADTESNNTASALIVSIPYMAPEQLNMQKYGINGKVSFNIDFWSLGVAVFEVITGQVLFRNTDEDSSEQVMSNILSSKLPKKLSALPDPFKKFVSLCLVKDARARANKAEELIAILEETPVSATTIPSKNIKASTPNLFEETELMKEELSEETKLYNPEQPHTKEMQEEAVQIPSPDEETVLIDSVPPVQNVEPSYVQNKIETDETAVLNNEEVDKIIEDGIPDTEMTEETTLLKSPQTNDGSEETVLLDKPVADQDETQLLKIDQAQDAEKKESNAFEAPVKLFSRYEYRPDKDLIGKGGFSRVYKAFDLRLDRAVALKVYKTSDYSERYGAAAEIRRVVNLDHPNICRYFDIEETEQVNTFGEKEKMQVCVMELLDGGNLSNYYRKKPDLQILKGLVEDILKGLAYLHKKGIIHRDIKPANILIRENAEGPVAKITDFGISKTTDSANTNSSSALIVSIPFMAPEQLNPRKYGINETISSNLDLWSLGVTLYEVITGKVLFKNTDQDTSEQIMANIMSPEVPEKINELKSPFREVVSLCLVKDARTRVQKAEELIDVLNGVQLGKTAPTIPAIEKISENRSETPGKKVEEPVIRSRNSFVIEEEVEKPRKPKYEIKLTRRQKMFVLVGFALLLILLIILRFTKAETRIALPVEPTDSTAIKRQIVIPSTGQQPDSAIRIDSTKAIADTGVTKKGQTGSVANADTGKNNSTSASSRNRGNTRPEEPLYKVEIRSTKPCTVYLNGAFAGRLGSENNVIVRRLKAGSYKLLSIDENGKEFEDNIKLHRNSPKLYKYFIY